MRPREPRIALLAAALAGAVSTAIPARAFERATVDGDPTTELSWPVREVTLRIADDTSQDVGPPELRDAIGRSLTTWSGAGGCTDISLLAGGRPLSRRTNMMGGAHDGENRIVFREDAWPEELGPETLAITTIVYRRSTGEILDADIDVNAIDHAWSALVVPAEGANDVENTMTHEVGHFLGFAHVADATATMFGQSDVGDVAKRDLAADDELAVCTVYPLGGTTPGGEDGRPPLSGGCALLHASGRLPALVIVAALAAMFARLRPARRRT